MREDLKYFLLLYILAVNAKFSLLYKLDCKSVEPDAHM